MSHISTVNAMNIGERIEIIILSRTSGLMGEYLDDDKDDDAAMFGKCKIDNVVYHIKRHIEVDSPFFWEVLNVNTGKITYCEDNYDLGCLKVIP